MLIGLLLTAQPAAAVELLVVEGRALSPVVYTAPDPVTTQVNAAAARLSLPIPVQEGLYLIPGLSYRLEAPRFIDPPDSMPAIPLLHGAEASLALFRTGLGDWSVMGRLSIGLAGDLTAADRDVVRLGGLALASRQVSEELKLGAGISANYVFGQLMPIPLIQVHWAPSEAVLLDALLPSHASLTYTWQERLRIGALAELIGNEYAIRDPALTATYCPEDGDSACLDHIAYTDGNAGVLAGARISGGLWLELHAGGSFYRRFEMLSADNVAIQGGDQRLSSAAFGRLRLRYVY